MKVFKFGGASVKDAKAVKNVKRILDLYPKDNLIVVISAMGKTTNALEELIASHINQRDSNQIYHKITLFHAEILNELFPNKTAKIYRDVEQFLQQIKKILKEEPTDHYDYIYDQVVSYGELLSTTIVSAFLNENGIDNNWLDARKLIRTDNTYREGKIDWSTTNKNIKSALSVSQNSTKTIYVTQGFIGHTAEGLTTTLGREGSDFTAGIFAYCMDAKDVTIWKDVPGMLNADPKWFEDTEKLDEISYKEAIELAYYGASVIHPKTIKPLQNKQIPLFVKSFLQPENEGTIIQASNRSDRLVTSYIFKRKQVLLSISPKDFSFIVEHNLRDIFNTFHEHRVKINLMQNSAISFSACAGGDRFRIDALIEDLSRSFSVKYNNQVELLTIRHYDQDTIDRLTEGKEVLVIQRSRQTARIVMK
ncbi:aspartate kinase [Flavobacteriales bacterium]|nr:aspartate kinase [Flavobacteriales bacterium]